MMKILSNLGTCRLEPQTTHYLLASGSLVLGADVRHEDGASSIAALVGASRPPFNIYWSSCRAQMPQVVQEGQRQLLSKEHIDDMKGMVTEILHHHKDSGDEWPKRVFMFR